MSNEEEVIKVDEQVKEQEEKKENVVEEVKNETTNENEKVEEEQTKQNEQVEATNNSTEEEVNLEEKTPQETPIKINEEDFSELGELTGIKHANEEEEKKEDFIKDESEEPPEENKEIINQLRIQNAQGFEDDANKPVFPTLPPPSSSAPNYFQQPPPIYLSNGQNNYNAPPISFNYITTIPDYSFMQPPPSYQSAFPLQAQNQNLYASAPNINFFRPQAPLQAPAQANLYSTFIPPSHLVPPSSSFRDLGKSGEYISDFTQNRSKGLQLFSDVLSRADKNDDGALSFEEFRNYFQDSLLNDEELLDLFNQIDVSHNGNISLLELDSFFRKGFDQFQFLFNSLAKINRCVSQSLETTSKLYPAQTFYEQFKTRFFLKEFIYQMDSITSPIAQALHSLEASSSSPAHLIRKKEKEEEEEYNNNHYFNSLNISDKIIASELPLQKKLKNEVDRLSKLVDGLYNKQVKLEWDNKVIDIEEEDFVVVSRTFEVVADQIENFDQSLSKYYSLSRSDLLHMSIRKSPEQLKFRVFEIFENNADFIAHKRSSSYKDFQKEIIDYLDDPIQINVINLPKSWWKRS